MYYAIAWTVRGSNPIKNKSFPSSIRRPDGLWYPLNILLNMYRLFFPGCKTTGE